MSTAEPFMPADEPTSEGPFEEFEIDPDEELDILPGAVDDDEVAPEFSPNPLFRSPTPGDRISEDQLEDDLG
jgi:hypothetical protein